ncbi:hypothetical protein [Collimonas pratensis]|uniref:hypothetical protein n=1 Tax=Collimonas pratensis TaxID=279113 RepID=UPI0012E82C74|nr:hypothetical protein [Collimonas pratensis]
MANAQIAKKSAVSARFGGLQAMFSGLVETIGGSLPKNHAEIAYSKRGKAKKGGVWISMWHRAF